MSERETEFSVFGRIAEFLLNRIVLKNHPEQRSNNHGYAAPHIVALYMSGKISRYAVTQLLSDEWYWNKSMNEFDLIELFEEIEKYKPEYKGVYDVKQTDAKPGTNRRSS